MKKILNLVFLAMLFAAIGINFYSCGPTAPNEQNTTTLLSAPSSMALTATAPKDSSAISLSCGCQFGPLDINSGPLTVTGYGDTSVIKFSFKESIGLLLNIHTLYATIDPATLHSPGSSSSWIELYFLDQGKYPLYDTIRVTATY